MTNIDATKALAHDIRNLLSPALLVVECIKTEYPDVNEATLSKIYKAIDKTVDVCQSKLNELNGTKTKRSRSFNVFDIVYEGAELCKLHTSKNVTFKIEVTPSDRVIIDKTTFFRAIVNLLQNAVGAVPAVGGDIIVRSSRFKGGLLISIIDNGAGIPNSICDSLMKCLETNGEINIGLGIGLPSTIKAISKIGGKLDLAYTSNNGTCFTIFVPENLEAINRAPNVRH